MTLHLTSLLTVTVLGSLAIGLFYLYFLKLRSVKLVGISVLLLSLLFVAGRLFFPVEFAFTKSIYIDRGLPEVIHPLHDPVGVLLGEEITGVDILAGIWILVAAALIIRTFTTYFSLKRQITRSATAIDAYPMLSAALDTLCGDGQHSEFVFVVSPVVSSPMITGYFKPMIILPPLPLSTEEWIYVLQHEMNHHYFKDLWIKLFFRLLQNIYWWSPIFYILNRLISEILEIRNDKKVLADLSPEDQIAYFRCLARVTEYQKRPKDTVSERLSMAFRSNKASVARRRFKLIVDLDGDSKEHRVRNLLMNSVFVILLTTVTVLSFAVIFEPYSVPDPIAAQSFAIDSTNAFLVKESEDVHVLYVNNERLATLTDGIDNEDSTLGSLALLPIYNSLEEALQK